MTNMNTRAHFNLKTARNPKKSVFVFSRNNKSNFTTKLYLAHRKTGRPNWKPVRQIRKPVNPIGRPANMLYFISCNFEVKNVVVKNMERLRNIIVIDFRH